MSLSSEYLLSMADRYQHEDGTPGDLATTWGWRDMARHLRMAAAECEHQDAVGLAIEKQRDALLAACECVAAQYQFRDLKPYDVVLRKHGWDGSSNRSSFLVDLIEAAIALCGPPTVPPC